MDINYHSDPAIAKLEEKEWSIWKQLDRVVSDTYTEIQKKVNERTRPEADRYRELLARAFIQAVVLRGGGSASGQLDTFAPAHEEWIIAHFGAANNYSVSNEEFTSRFVKALTNGAGVALRL
jgi:hypothetical protein